MVALDRRDDRDLCRALRAVERIEKTPTWALWVQLVLGVMSIAWGVHHWTTGNRSSESPAWMRQITAAGPSKTFGTAAFLAVVNPKLVLISAAAGVAIGTAGWAWAADFGAVVFYSVIGTSTIILPVVAYLAAGERLAGPLGTVKNWMEKHNGTLVAVVLVLLGVNSLVKSIQALT